MSKVQIAVCDDESFSRETVEAAVRQIFAEENIETEIHRFEAPKKLADYNKIGEMDLIYLDIEMPEINGIKLGRILKEKSQRTEIIYVSNREDTVFQALRIQPLGFVRKNHFMKDIKDITSMYIRQYQKKQEERKLIVKEGEGFRSISMSTIRYIEGSGTYQYVNVSDQDEPIRIRSRMGTLETELSEEGFLRIHKGYLVNYQYIDRITAAQVILDQGEELPISRGQGSKIKTRFLELSRENGQMLF